MPRNKKSVYKKSKYIRNPFSDPEEKFSKGMKQYYSKQNKYENYSFTNLLSDLKKIGKPPIGKNLERKGIDLSTLPTIIEKETKKNLNLFTKDLTIQIKQYSKLMKGYAYGNIANTKITKQQLHLIDESLKNYKKTGLPENLVSLVKTLQESKKEFTEMYVGEKESFGVKDTTKFIQEIKGRKKDTDAINEGLKEFHDRIFQISERLDDLSKNTIEKFKDKIESIPFLGNWLNKLGLSDKFQKVMEKSFSGGIKKSVNRAIQGKSPTMMGLPFGTMGMLGATTGIAALGYAATKLIEGVVKFTELVKDTAKVMKTTRPKAIEATWAAQAARGKSVAGTLAIGETPVTMQEATDIQAEILRVTSNQAMLYKTDLLPSLYTAYKQYALTYDEISGIAEVIEMMSGDINKSIENVPDFFKKITKSADKFGASREKVIENIKKDINITSLVAKGAEKAFTDLEARMARLGTTAGKGLEVFDMMGDVAGSIDKVITAQRQLTRIGANELANVINYGEMQRTYLFGSVEQYDNLMLKYARKAVKEHDRILNSGAKNALRRAQWLQKIMEETFGLPYEEMKKMARTPEDVAKEKIDAEVKARIEAVKPKTMEDLFTAQQAGRENWLYTPVNNWFKGLITSAKSKQHAKEGEQKALELYQKTGNIADLPPEMQKQFQTYQTEAANINPITGEAQGNTQNINIENVDATIDDKSINYLSKTLTDAIRSSFGNIPINIYVGGTKIGDTIMKEAWNKGS